MRKKSGQCSTPVTPRMAHPNLAQRREMVATLQRDRVSFDSLVVESLCQEFGCTAKAIQNDIRVLKNDTKSREKLARYWRRGSASDAWSPKWLP
ncbi:MAG TPA: hypothetical protein VFO40_16515 [Chthoniobacterales bacterium]|nr:hypothetical protein [Chthoniobacterales bacterium]